jgi:hypothetical protein
MNKPMKNLPVFFFMISILLLGCTEKGKEWSETTDANGLRYQQVPIYPSLRDAN